MKFLFSLLLLLLITSCSGDKVAYWCGDHQCVNKKEKEEYFKKNMVVEVREIGKKKLENKSEVEKIIQQAQMDGKLKVKEEKILTKQAKLEEKREIKKQKALAKQAKKDEKRRIKEQKALAKQAKKDEKKRIKEQKILSKELLKMKKKNDKKEKTLVKKIKKEEKKIIKKRKKMSKTSVNPKITSTNFQKIVKEIQRRNIFKSYPDINDIPN
tara:strand:- start:2459 stop:3094 length:636 start_codon:yes stop_codon:yes gene_type:complete